MSDNIIKKYAKEPHSQLLLIVATIYMGWVVWYIYHRAAVIWYTFNAFELIWLFATPLVGYTCFYLKGKELSKVRWY